MLAESTEQSIEIQMPWYVSGQRDQSGIPSPQFPLCKMTEQDARGAHP